MLKLLGISLWLAVHPVHVTLMSVEYSAEKKIFDVYLRVYYDDFLVDYELLTGRSHEMDIVRNKTEATKGLTVYLKEKIQIVNGNKILDFKVNNIRLADNELSIFMQFRNQGKPGKILIRNSILADIYEDQSNLLIVRCGDFEEGVKLTPEKREHLFDIKYDI